MHTGLVCGDMHGANVAGFFTSRPLLKYFARTQSAVLQAARQLQLLAGLPLRKHIDGDIGGCDFPLALCPPTLHCHPG